MCQVCVTKILFSFAYIHIHTQRVASTEMEFGRGPTNKVALIRFRACMRY